jgi:hypothetical protein
MPLNPVPQAAQTLAQTQNPILVNFATIATAFAIDHVDYNIAQQGMHNQVTMPRQVGDSATAGNNVALYAKLNAAGSETALFFRKQTNGVIYDFTSSLQNLNGWTRLPSGILLKWGQFNANAGATTTINYPVGAGIPVFTAIYNVQCTSLNGAGAGTQAPQLTNLLVGSFDIFNRTIGLPVGATNGPFNYFAIGLG